MKSLPLSSLLLAIILGATISLVTHGRVSANSCVRARAQLIIRGFPGEFPLFSKVGCTSFIISEDKDQYIFTHTPLYHSCPERKKEKKSPVFFYYLIVKPEMLGGKSTYGGRHSRALWLFIAHVRALFITIASSQIHLNNL